MSMNFDETRTTLAPPLGDPEQDSITVFIPPAPGSGALGAKFWLTFDKYGDEVVAVHYQDADYQQRLRDQGYDPHETWVDGYVEGLARAEYFRRGR